MKSHEFEFHGGRTDDLEQPGKSEWPDTLTINMSRFFAWELVDSLLHQLRFASNDDPITYSICGKLDYDVPDE